MRCGCLRNVQEIQHSHKRVVLSCSFLKPSEGCLLQCPVHHLAYRAFIFLDWSGTLKVHASSYFSWRNLKHKGVFNLVTQIYCAQLWDYKQLS